jgi:hypothetical protein
MRHPPGEPLRLPYTIERGIGITIELVHLAGAVEASLRAAEKKHVGGGEIQSLGAGRGNDVGGVPREIQTSRLQPSLWTCA